VHATGKPRRGATVARSPRPIRWHSTLQLGSGARADPNTYITSLVWVKRRVVGSQRPFRFETKRAQSRSRFTPMPRLGHYNITWLA
jgi:hypothetical protein